MTKKIYHFTICLLITANASFAQWTGSTGPTGNISREGNVGIGVGITNPSAKLEIANNGNASLRVGITSNMANTHTQLINSLAVVGDNSSTITSNAAAAWNFYNNGSNPSWSGTLIQHAGTAVQGNLYGFPAGNLGMLVFQNVSNGVIASNGANIHISPFGVTTASFLSNGNVGIGTTNPGSFKLAVEGKIGAREIQVTVQYPFPDYVFDSKYELKNLFSLEKYINENKHLPGIPSAAEVEKQGGIELGKMNTKLLEKIEELTLYVIELKKENEQMKKEIKKLKK